MKFKLKKLIGCILIACYPVAFLNANPSGGTVANGSASFNQQGKTLNITNSPGTIINWQNFSISEDEKTKFIQQSVDSAVLNRVTSQNPSDILGSLQSNGRVFIINPNGISFGKNSIVDVGGLVASTLNLSNEDFLSQQLNFNGDGTNGGLTAQGEIITPEGGLVYLIAPNVENHGVITSPKGEVILAAGHSVQLIHSDNPDIRVTLTAPEGEVVNVGEIITRGGKTSIYAGLINQQGTINADSAVVGENGKIFFKASTKTILSSSSITTANGVNGGSVKIETTQGLTEVSGKVSAKGTNGKGGEVLILGEHVGLIGNANIDASGTTGGGTVLIGGDNKGENLNVKNAKATYVGVNTQIHADAINEGDGGKVILWSDDATRAYGTITAKGGTVFGDGGFVETSGGYLDVAGLNLDVTATNGNGGTWLLDPYNITISGTTTINVTGSPNYTPIGSGSNIFNGDINNQLDAGTSVIIDTTGAGSEAGNITVDAAITKTIGPAATLTLKAHNNIITNASISSSLGAMHVVLTADQDSNGTGAVTLNNNITTLGGNVTITSAGDITLSSGGNTIIAANAAVSLTSTNGAIIGDTNTGLIDISTGTGSVALSAANGIYVNGGTDPLFVSTSSINFTNNTTGVVHIFNNRVGALSVSGTHNGTGNVIIKNSDTTNPLTASGITTNNGYIAIRTGQIDITGAINAGTNNVYLAPYTSSAISIGGAQNFDLTQAELTNITSGNTYVGRDNLNVYATTVDIASAAAVDVGARNLYVYNTGNMTIGANNIAATGGLLHFYNSGGAGTFTSGVGQIAGANANFNNFSNVLIGSGGVNVTGTADFTVTDADINGTITANRVNFTQYGGTAISLGGSATYDLTQADLLNVNSSTGIYVGRTNGTTTDIASVGSVDIGAKKLYVISGDGITIGANSFSAVGGSINLQNYKAGADITTGTGTITSNTVSLTSLDQITIGAGGINSAGNLSLSSGSVLTQSGNLVTTSGGIIKILANSATLNNITSAGNVEIETDQITIANTIDAGGNNVYVMPRNLNPISIDGTETFDLTQGELSNITNFNSLTIGSNGTTTRATTASISSSASTTVGSGSGTGIIRALNDITFGSNNFSAIGANMTFTSDNGNIITGLGNILTGWLTFNAANDISVNSGGINASNSITLTANNSVLQNGNLTANGNGTITVTATNKDINMASGTTTTGGNGDVVYNAGNNITVALLDSGLADTTINAGATVLDNNGNGVNNIIAKNLTVSSAGNASLDYKIVGALNSSGVTGVADLRAYPAATTTATAPSSTNEPLTTSIDTISNTTNSLSSNLSLTSTSTSTAPLPVESTDTSSEETLATASSEESTASESTEEETKDEKSESTKNNDKKKTTLASKKLPICK